METPGTAAAVALVSIAAAECASRGLYRDEIAVDPAPILTMQVWFSIERFFVGATLFDLEPLRLPTRAYGARNRGAAVGWRVETGNKNKKAPATVSRPGA